MAVKQSFTVIFLGYYSSLKYIFKVRTRHGQAETTKKKKFNESISEKKSNESQDDI